MDAIEPKERKTWVEAMRLLSIYNLAGGNLQNYPSLGCHTGDGVTVPFKYVQSFIWISRFQGQTRKPKKKKT